MQRKYDTTNIGIFAFLECVEVLAQKVYKDEESTFKENVEAFLDIGIEFFEEFLEQ